MDILHTFHDGSVLRKLSAKSLITIPIWKGNRILNTEHVTNLRKAIGTGIQLLDSGYCTIQYPELDAANNEVMQTYIVDGQHRTAVLKEYFEPPCFDPDFIVLVRQKTVKNETEAIRYFNAINNSKPQQWQHDPKLVANSYIVAMEGVFNQVKGWAALRQGATHRPFLSTDRLREQLLLHKLNPDPEAIAACLQKLSEWNRRKCQETQLRLAMEPEAKDAKLWAKALELECMLAMDFSWITVLL
jgi:hypothetical protein